MLGRFSFIFFLFFRYYFKMRLRTHTQIVGLATLQVSLNHAALNQSLIFFSYIVITTGCHHNLGRFERNHSLSILAAAQFSRQVGTHQYNKWSTTHLQIIFVSKLFLLFFCAVDKIISFLLTQIVKGWEAMWRKDVRGAIRGRQSGAYCLCLLFLLLSSC